MTGVTPKYGISYPDANTKAARLGIELRQMALDLEAALAAGAQPGPVDTGWVAITQFLNGFTPRGFVGYRRIGQQMFMSGQLYIAAAPVNGLAAFQLPGVNALTAKTTVFQATVIKWGAMNTLAVDGNMIIESQQARTTGQGLPLDGMSWLISS